jgi:CheY-like chemotaxis protein
MHEDATLGLGSHDEPLASATVQLVVADIAMPTVDGYELIRRLRAAGCTVPAVAVTAFRAR